MRRRTVRQRHIENVEDHGNPGVIAENSYQLDDAPVAQEALHALVVAFADPALLVKLLDKIEDRTLVLGGFFRRAAGLDVADHFRLNAGLLGDWRMGVPLVLGAPHPR